MNLSGRAVRQVMQFYKTEVADLLIICDDIAIPMGALRLRLTGSDGGHNGLTSVIYELATRDFARLRLGVGSDFRKGDQVRYVLGKFGPNDQDLLQDMLKRSEEGCLAVSEQGAEKAMNLVNYTPPSKTTSVDISKSK
jgi:PTH1 family peptidyl-tRNA hydrolase